MVPAHKYQVEAQKAFLGHGPVIGVGVVVDPEEKLVFLFKETSKELEHQISDWASARGVLFTVEVTGSLAIG